MATEINKMALPRVTTRPPPHVDPTQARIAYGERAFPKLVSL